MSRTDHTILLAEDNEDDVFLMRRAIKTAGILNPVQVVEDGQEAIDYLGGTARFADRTRYPYPQVVFLDLKMPRKSGFDVMEWFELRPDLPRPVIVLLTSSNAPQDIERGAKAGSFYAIKPPTKELFHRLTTEFGIRWQVAEHQITPA